MKSTRVVVSSLLRTSAVRLTTASTTVATPSSSSSSSTTLANPPPQTRWDVPTIPIEDAQEAFARHSAAEGAQERQRTFEKLSQSLQTKAGGALATLHRRCRASGDYGPFWNAFKAKGKNTTGAAAGTPPQWFVDLCKDLQFRTNMTDEFDEMAASSDIGGREDLSAMPPPASSSPAAAASPPKDFDPETFASQKAAAEEAMLRAEDGEDASVDPYLWLGFNLLPEAEYDVGSYTFPTSTEYDTETRVKLCLGGQGTEYVCFSEAYPFPDRRQLPTSMGTTPCKLWVKPSDTVPIVYIQLGEHFPPATWLPVKATAGAIRRVLGEFAGVAVLHRDRHHANFESMLARAKAILTQSNMAADDSSVLRYAAYDAGKVTEAHAPTNEYRNYQDFFLGEYDDPSLMLEYLSLCPTLFSLPHMRTDANIHEEEFVPTIEGPGIATSLFRTVYSKSLVHVKVHLSCEVKLPPQDIEGFQKLWSDVDRTAVPKSRIPIFVRVSWMDNEKMCGGSALVKRFNKLFQTEFALDMPIDLCMSLFYTMQWAKEMPNFLGIHGMRDRLDGLLEAASHPENQKALPYPGTRELTNPQYTIEERIGMHVQYLAHMGDPSSADLIKTLHSAGSAPIRMGCAKAALELGDRQLFHYITSSEPVGRMQHYMTKLVVKRKKRDLTDAIPKILDEQYEFGAPLWTRGGKFRLDASTVEGNIDINRISGSGSAFKAW